ncbi:dihydrofolate reductase family protein [Cognatiyoonia sp. IB215182]|uniref:dihydrofolate reductase family protein n=1 Tax=Cognatiyoonia sp. IB215182 TaxID=3097353 RepID=UPI002A0DEE57|nr:dihydrofolate reductase family protein [Cognatiyoonia sp. IB215182]MDX8355810.1 dihydrofolate reductase family protein [Cognatiyoonia sp. IB215182]
MRELAILMFQSVDGVVQSPSMPDEDPSGGFKHGGWAAPFWSVVMDHVGREAMSQPYDIVFGRKTYDAFASHWPNVQNDPAGDMMNSARKYVASRGTPKLHWANSKLLSGDIVSAIRALKEEDGPLLQVHGSADLTQTLLTHDLIDEYRLWTFPVILGSGKRLVEDTHEQMQMSLVKFEALANGVSMSIYRRG